MKMFYGALGWLCQELDDNSADMQRRIAIWRKSWVCMFALTRNSLSRLNIKISLTRCTASQCIVLSQFSISVSSKQAAGKLNLKYANSFIASPLQSEMPLKFARLIQSTFQTSCCSPNLPQTASSFRFFSIFRNTGYCMRLVWGLKCWPMIARLESS